MNSHRHTPPRPPPRPRLLQPPQWRPAHPPPPPPHVVHSAVSRPWPPPNGFPVLRQPPPIQSARPPWPPRPAPSLNQLHPPRHHVSPHHTFPYTQRRFARPPPPHTDPEASWLAGFAQRHLIGSQLNDEQAGLGDPEAPLRRIRRRLLEMRELLDELEASAIDLIDLESKVNSHGIHDPLDTARLKVQVERKKARCEELRSKLELLEVPKPLGLGTDLKRDVVAFTRRIQKKRVYRQRLAEKRRAERRIREGLGENVGLAAVEDDADDLGLTRATPSTSEPEAIQPMSTHSRSTQDPSCDTVTSQRDTRVTAQKALLVLELQKIRHGNEMTEYEKEKLERTRDQVTARLSEKKTRKRKRKRKPRLTTSSEREKRSTPDLSGASPATLEASRATHRVLPLTDPYPLDMETLITLRRQWDSYLVPAKLNGASAIPPSFIEPPATPTARWAHYLNESREVRESVDSQAV